MPRRLAVVVNPASGRGRAARMLPEVEPGLASLGAGGLLEGRAEGVRFPSYEVPEKQ